MDDLIDAAGAAAEAGKDVGKDLKKTTFVSFSGVDGARQLAEELVEASHGGACRSGRAPSRSADLAALRVARRR